MGRRERIGLIAGILCFVFLAFAPLPGVPPIIRRMMAVALLMAIWKRKPKEGLIWHTDRGSQYASTSHRKIIKNHKLVQSMSRKGNCWDNAISESFFHSLKVELVHENIYKTREIAKQSIFEYIECYFNNQRIHSAIDYRTPNELELVA